MDLMLRVLLLLCCGWGSEGVDRQGVAAARVLLCPQRLPRQCAACSLPVLF